MRNFSNSFAVVGDIRRFRPNENVQKTEFYGIFRTTRFCHFTNGMSLPPRSRYGRPKDANCNKKASEYKRPRASIATRSKYSQREAYSSPTTSQVKGRLSTKETTRPIGFQNNLILCASLWLEVVIDNMLKIGSWGILVATLTANVYFIPLSNSDPSSTSTSSFSC